MYTRSQRVQIIRPTASKPAKKLSKLIPNLEHSATPSSTIVPTLTPTGKPTFQPNTDNTLGETKIPATPTLTPASSGQAKVFVNPTSSYVTPIPTNTATDVRATSDVKKDFIMQEINEYRRSQGLSEVHTDSNTCDFAKVRATELTQNFSHDGFRSRIDNKTLPYSNYSSVTENIAMNSDYRKIVDMWINSSGHAENMRKDTPFVCVESSGNYYAYEGWRP